MNRLTLILALTITLIVSFCIISCDPKPAIVGSPGAGIMWKFSKVSGDGQSAAQFDTLQDRLVVKLETLQEDPVRDVYVIFTVISGNGQVQKPNLTGEVAGYAVPTDAAGLATSQFLNFGGDSLGNSTVRAQIEDSAQFFVEFTIGTN